MSITFAQDALSAVNKAFQIKREDSLAKCIVNFAGGSASKSAIIALAAFESITAKMGSILPIRAAAGLAEYANEADRSIREAVFSLNHPFVPTIVTTSRFFGLFSKTTTIEGPTVTSYIQRGISKATRTIHEAKKAANNHKMLITASIILPATAYILYSFDFSLSSKTSEMLSRGEDLSIKTTLDRGEDLSTKATLDNLQQLVDEIGKQVFNLERKPPIYKMTQRPITSTYIIISLAMLGAAIKNPQFIPASFYSFAATSNVLLTIMLLSNDSILQNFS